jgi:hypothetical protein
LKVPVRRPEISPLKQKAETVLSRRRGEARRGEAVPAKTRNKLIKFILASFIHGSFQSIGYNSSILNSAARWIEIRVLNAVVNCGPRLLGSPSTQAAWNEDVKQNVYLAPMKKKQMIQDGDCSHSQLRALDAVVFTYPGWLENFKEVEQTQIANPAEFNSQLSQMKKKEQMLHDGDRSHSRLRALYTITFPSWGQTH